ncbi:hypothetical protein [Flavobacterium inviolabile]|uniref:hypothetical protein n=1 Tax=Flavobacterium inviolabile TaxID=2748320 RepID=UPI0015A7F712|nr:hypothetical protein [Flavobacterium inviolabile]
MIKQIRNSKFTKVVAWYLTLMIFVEITQPIRMYALTSGPSQPEFNSFTPIGTSDMVDLASGDFNYNIPIMDVGGYPLNLSYNAGITTDQEASWVGLGWNLNVGQIERQVRGLPDDFNGDKIKYENDLRDNITVGTHFGFNAAFAGYDAIRPGVGLGVQYNNYEGITFKPSFGANFALSENVAVGLNFSSSVSEGASVNPSVSISKKLKEKATSAISSESLKGTGGIGLGFSSRKGVENLNLSASVRRIKNVSFSILGNSYSFTSSKGGGVGGSISFNDQSYTPSKRVGFENSSFTFNGAFGGEFYLGEFQAQLTGYGSYQKVASQYRNRTEKAYGYDNTEYKRKQAGVMDFNRENDRTVTENTTALPVTNYTYDIYNIEGQGVSGMFRPYRSQVGYLYNDRVSDYGVGVSLGAEFGIGNLVHGGIDFKVAPSSSSTGGWVNNNPALQYFNESSDDTKALGYEPVTYKLVGSTVVDPEQSIYFDKIHQTKALRIGLGGSTRNRMTTNNYNETLNNSSYAINSKIKRTKRYLRNQVIHKVTAEETAGDPFVIKNDSAKVHHTAGIKVLQTDGSTYVYGKTAYNTKKVEATFDVSKQPGNNTTGLVPYNGTTAGNNTNVSDKFLNKITTPAYAHSYLITSVLSADYEDVDSNGPSLNDLGTFTKFDYTTINNYQWRIPFQSNTANYNEGLISNKDDQKGTYIYGTKQLVYLDKISTKTHVAFFDLEDRQDAVGVSGEHGGAGSGRMKRIKSIRLYSRPEVTNASGAIFDPGIDGAVKPIKTAHFDYDYSLCQNTPNSLASTKGKLTLKRVYFTYRSSNMGKYTPYVFNYGLEKSKDKPSDYTINNDPVNNPEYNPKGFDIWGNYKVNPAGSGNINTPLSNSEYPFVQQGDKTLADNNTGAWTLKSVQLPSGGVIAIETESDDYQYVQNKRAMQMFKVIGAGTTNTPGSNNITNTLYGDGSGHKKYLYVKLNAADSITTRQQFIDRHLGENYNKAIQFRFLMNMTANDAQYDYVSGYFEIEENENQNIKINVLNHETYGPIAAIPLKFLNRDGASGDAEVNPIVKTGWGFGRTYLNRIVYSIGGDATNTNFVSIVNDLVASITAIGEIFSGPNKALQNKGCARMFKTDKSWIRLENAKGRKLGGGLRVKSIRLSDEWGSMLDNNQSGGTDLSNMEYGQIYSYNDDHKRSSGVATYEPNGSSENALLEPLYPKNGSYAQNISAPKENNYVEKPFGENFFPAPRVTYSRVMVKNLPRKDGNKKVERHATGMVITRHYTSYDFPTKVEFTDPDIKNDIPDPSNIMNIVVQLANVVVRSHLTMSQGYSIETNDMNGKIKSQEVYAEGQNSPISKVEYKYNIAADGTLDNTIQTINEKGEVKKQLMGVDYDMVNDFNESHSESELAGFDGNLAAFLVAIFPAFVPTILPKYSYNENLLRTAVTTKHVHKTGIMVEKIAYDLGSTVSTKNLAWDASSGEVILNQTINEYGDQYYSLTYPAYWKYDGMGLASTNIGLEGSLRAETPVTSPPPPNNDGTPILATGKPYFKINFQNDLTKFFHLGDELYIKTGTPLEPIETQALAAPSPGASILVNRLWVIGFKSDKSGILLMDKDGNYFNKCEDYVEIPFKIVRSGYRNLQAASMASVTLMKNPVKITDAVNQTGILDQDILTYSGSATANPRILNASAVVYNDYWKPQSENNLPYYPEPTANPNSPIDAQGNPNYPYAVRVNPYLWNIKGDWKTEKSYAYLTSRNASATTVNNPRNEGFFAKFTPFYIVTNGLWSVNTANWTSASSITLYSPYGTELENKDALNRYSAAQYGYNYTLPMAIASNSKYSEMGFEGFEETPKNGTTNPSHFSFDTSNASYATNHSHTGKKSIKVSTGQSVKLSRELVTAPASIPKETCPSSAGENPPSNCTFNFTRNSCSSGGDTDACKGLKLTFPVNVATVTVTTIPSPTQVALTIPNNNIVITGKTVQVNIIGDFLNGADNNGQNDNQQSSLNAEIQLNVTLVGNTSPCCIIIKCEHNVSGGTTQNYLGVTPRTCNNNQ